MSRHKQHLALPRAQPRITPEKLWARHQELQTQLRETGALWQQAQDAIDTESEKPEIERDDPSLVSMREIQARLTTIAEQTIADLERLDIQLAPHLAKQQGGLASG